MCCRGCRGGCVVVVVEGREGVEKGTQNRTISLVVPLRNFPLDTWSLTALSGKANDWRNRERVVLSGYFW